MTLGELFLLVVGRRPASQKEVDFFINVYNLTATQQGLSPITWDPDFNEWEVPTGLAEALHTSDLKEAFLNEFHLVWQTELPKVSGVDKADARDAYRQHLRGLGVWNPTNKVWTSELDQRFEEIWSTYAARIATGEWTPYRNAADFRDDLLSDQTGPYEHIPAITPETEKEFMARFKEEQLYKEEFANAFDRLRAEGGIGVADADVNAVKALQGKAYKDAAYRGAAGSPQDFIMGSIEEIINQVQAQSQESIRQAKTQQQQESIRQAETQRERLLAQLVQAGDYDRAARFLGPPPLSGASLKSGSLLEREEVGKPDMQAEVEKAAKAGDDRRVQTLLAAADTEQPPSQEDLGYNQPDGTPGRESNAVMSARVLGELRSDLAGASVISDVEQSRRSFEPVLNEAIAKQDPGFQQFLRPRFPERLSDKQIVGFRGALQGKDTTFADFIGQKFEELRPQYDEQSAPVLKQQTVAAQQEENRQTRSFRTRILTKQR